MPRFKHDCEKCQFVGTFEGCDGYVCVSPNRTFGAGSVVVRYGDDGPDYASVPMEIAERPTSGRYHDVLKLKLALEGKVLL